MSNYYPGGEAYLVIPVDNAIHFAIAHETDLSMQGPPILHNIPTDFGVGDLDCPLYHIRKAAPSKALVSSELDTHDYRGLLAKGGLNLGS